MEHSHAMLEGTCVSGMDHCHAAGQLCRQCEVLVTPVLPGTCVSGQHVYESSWSAPTLQGTCMGGHDHSDACVSGMHQSYAAGSVYAGARHFHGARQVREWCEDGWLHSHAAVLV